MKTYTLYQNSKPALQVVDDIITSQFGKNYLMSITFRIYPLEYVVERYEFLKTKLNYGFEGNFNVQQARFIDFLKGYNPTLYSKIHWINIDYNFKTIEPGETDGNIKYIDK